MIKYTWLRFNWATALLNYMLTKNLFEGKSFSLKCNIRCTYTLADYGMELIWHFINTMIPLLTVNISNLHSFSSVIEIFFVTFKSRHPSTCLLCTALLTQDMMNV